MYHRILFVGPFHDGGDLTTTKRALNAPQGYTRDSTLVFYPGTRRSKLRAGSG